VFGAEGVQFGQRPRQAPSSTAWETTDNRYHLDKPKRFLEETVHWFDPDLLCDRTVGGLEDPPHPNPGMPYQIARASAYGTLTR
jgi:hypothetical protein